MLLDKAKKVIMQCNILKKEGLNRLNKILPISLGTLLLSRRMILSMAKCGGPHCQMGQQLLSARKAVNSMIPAIMEVRLLTSIDPVTRCGSLDISEQQSCVQRPP